MAGKSSQSNNRGSDLFGYFVSGKHKEYHTNQYGAPQTPPSGLTATGGAISDYIEPGGNIYRAHLFTSTGSFDVTSTSGDYGSTIDYLVVGGGGGGGKEGGGGGAGGVRSNHPDTPSPKRGTALTVAAGTNYTVTIGSGGAGVFLCPTGGSPAGTDGNGSHFGPGSPIPINTSGGGGGGSKRTNFTGTEVTPAEQVVLVDLAVVLVVTLTVLVVVVLQPHSPINLVLMEVIQRQVVLHPLVEVVVLVVPDKIIDQMIMQDMVVLE